MSLSGYWSALLADHDLPGRFELRFDDCLVRVRSNSRELLDELARYYQDFQCAGDPSIRIEVDLLEAPAPVLDLPFEPYRSDESKKTVKDEFVDVPDGRILRKRLTGMTFLFDERDGLAIGPCLKNSNQVVNFVNNRLMQVKIDEGYLLAHAAAVAHGENGIAVAANAGQGKSTLALTLVSHGFAFVSNDRLMIRRDGSGPRMLGLPKLPRVNPGTLMSIARLNPVLPTADRESLARLSTEELWRLEQKYDVDISDCFGPNRIRHSAAISAIAILNWRLGGGAMRAESIDLRDRPDLLAALIKATGVHYRRAPETAPQDATPAAYLEALRGCDVIEFSGGVDFEGAARRCRQALGGD